MWWEQDVDSGAIAAVVAVVADIEVDDVEVARAAAATPNVAAIEIVIASVRVFSIFGQFYKYTKSY